jgi:hypothetical protein
MSHHWLPSTKYRWRDYINNMLMSQAAHGSLPFLFRECLTSLVPCLAIHHLLFL